MAITKRHFFTRQANDAFDVRLVRSGGGIEDDDVAALRRIERVVSFATGVNKLIGVAVHEQHLPVVEVRQHAFAINAKVEHDETDEKKDQRGQQQSLDDLSHRAPRLVLGGGSETRPFASIRERSLRVPARPGVKSTSGVILPQCAGDTVHDRTRKRAGRSAPLVAPLSKRNFRECD